LAFQKEITQFPPHFSGFLKTMPCVVAGIASRQVFRHFVYKKQCSGSITFLYGSGYSDPYLFLTDSDPDLALSSVPFTLPNNFVIFFLSFLLITF